MSAMFSVYVLCDFCKHIETNASFVYCPKRKVFLHWGYRNCRRFERYLEEEEKCEKSE